MRRGGGQGQRERMPARDPVEPRRLVRLMAAPAEELLCLPLVKWAEGDVPEHVVPARSEPGGDGGLAAGEQDPLLALERRHQHLAQPRVHEREHLVVIQRQQHRAVEFAQPRRHGRAVGLGAAGRTGEGVEQPALRRLGRAAVERHGDDAGVPQPGEEGAQERRLADARVAVQVHDPGLTVWPGERLEEPQLVVATDEAPPRLFGGRRPERLWHGHEWSSGFEYPPCRAPCHPSGAARARAAPGPPALRSACSSRRTCPAGRGPSGAGPGSGSSPGAASRC